jgi:hypothetical protein
MECDLIGTILVTPNCLVGSTPLATARVFAGHASVTVPERGINDAIVLMMRRVSTCFEWCDGSGECEAGQTSRVAVDRYTCGSDNDPGRASQVSPIPPETLCSLLTLHQQRQQQYVHALRYQHKPGVFRIPSKISFMETVLISRFHRLSPASVVAVTIPPLTAPNPGYRL